MMYRCQNYETAVKMELGLAFLASSQVVCRANINTLTL
jgi:hypothetical protein